MIKLWKILRFFLCWFLGLAFHGWSALALYFCSFPSNDALRKATAIFYILVFVFLIVSNRKRTRVLFISLVGFLGVFFWFNTIQPKTNASYPEELTMPYVEFKSDFVSIRNVRNCDYRTKDDFDVYYETRKYDLGKLQTLDMLVNYWGMDAVAHTFLSFGFSDGRYITVSVEIRPEIGESYGEVKGLFKQYEIIYIWADERDSVRVRTNYKNEDVYLYRTSWPPDKVRALFMSMIERTNSLNKKPEFYNTLMESCTNTIGDHIIKADIFELPVWKRRFLSGTVDARAYDEGWLDNSRTFAELRRNSLINERARAADKDLNFSRKIRMHLF
jgi:hypothetical protein